MSTITKLKIQKNKKAVNLYLDDKFAFGISLEKVFSESLTVNKELTHEQVNKLFSSSQLEKLYQKTLNFLSYRPRSEKEIKNYLKKNCPTQDAIACRLGQNIQSKIIKKLKKQKFINDEKFAFWWIEQRLTFKPKGKWMLRAELIKKGIDRKIIDKVLSTINNQQLTIAAKKIIDKKLRLYQKLPKIKLKQKVFSHLARRGFDFDLIKKVIDEELEKR